MEHTVAPTQRIEDAADLEAIATFVRVVEMGSFSAAAKALGLPKSTVSRRLTRLEQAMGMRLVRRTTRRVEPTDEGVVLFERVAPALEAVSDATREVRDLSAQPAGTLRITAPPDLGSTHVPALALAFMRQFPRVSVHVELTERRMDLVREGIDLALRAGPVGDESMIARPIGVLDAWLFASPSYIEERGAPRSPDDLAQHACVALRNITDSRPVPFEGPRGEKASVELYGALSSNNFLFVRQAVLDGGGIGLMPAFLAARALAEGSLVRVLDGWAFRGGELHVVYPASRYIPTRVRAFRDFAIAWLQDPGQCPGLRPRER